MKESAVLAIDPSINDIGFVLLNKKGEYLSSKHIKPAKECSNAVEKVASLSKKIIEELNGIDYEIVEIVIEHTRFFAQNQRTSHAAAQKLNLMKGAIYGVCVSQCDCEVHMVWIPGFKKENANLLARANKLPKVTQHERDAFWLGQTWTKSAELLRNHWKENPAL